MIHRADLQNRQVVGRPRKLDASALGERLAAARRLPAPSAIRHPVHPHQRLDYCPMCWAEGRDAAVRLLERGAWTDAG